MGAKRELCSQLLALGEYSRYFPAGDAPSCTPWNPWGFWGCPRGAGGGAEPGEGIVGSGIPPAPGKAGSPPVPGPALLRENSQRELGWRELRRAQTGPATPPEGLKNLQDSRVGNSCSPGLHFAGNVDLGMLRLPLLPQPPFPGKFPPKGSRTAGNVGTGMREGLAGTLRECGMSSGVKIPGWSAPGEHEAWPGS